MLDTIIVGVDGLEGGRDAIALAARLAPLTGARVVLVHAYPDDPHLVRGAEQARGLLEAERRLAGVTAELAPCASRSAAQALHELAGAHEHGLVVIGASRRGALGRVVAGDAVRATLAGAPTAVAVAPKGYSRAGGGIARVGVGFDGSREGERALRCAAAFARAGGAVLDVLDVVENPAEPAF